jgi:hypothetical protein
MSRGPGIWQRGILAAVEHYGMVYLRDLLPDDARKSELNAVERAAWRLMANGRIEIVAFSLGRPRLLAVRPGLAVVGRPKRAVHRPLSVGQVPSRNCPHVYDDCPSKDIVPEWPGWRHTRHFAARTA